MSYISADGTVGGKKSPWSMVSDFLGGIWSLVCLFFSTMTNPKALEEGRRSANTRTYAQRNQGRSYRSGGGGQSLGRGGSSTTTKQRPKGSNIRGLNHLGDADCQISGG